MTYDFLKDGGQAFGCFSGKGGCYLKFVYKPSLRLSNIAYDTRSTYVR